MPSELEHLQALRRRYHSVKHRCYYPRSTVYVHYGGRGIQMCDEWKHSFDSFYDWAIKAGFSPALTLERINNDGNYEPSNCAWVDKKTQANNRRSSRHIEAFGEVLTLQQWADKSGMSRDVIARRLDRGWSVERSLTEKAVLGRNQYGN